MKRKLMSLLLALVMVLSMLPVPTAFAETETVHDGYTAWTSSNSLPTEAGKYCLMANVTLSSDWNTPTGETTLCLHGHTIYGRIANQGSRILNIENCQTVGGISNEVSANTQAGCIYNTGTLNLYGGTISGKITTPNMGDNGGGIYNNGVCNIYGGSITNCSAQYGGGIYNNNILCLYDYKNGDMGNTALQGSNIYNKGTIYANESWNAATMQYYVYNLGSWNKGYLLTCDDAANGTVTTIHSRELFAEGETVKLKVTPADGYKVATVKVKNEEITVDDNGYYPFTMPANAVNIVALFEAASETYTVTTTATPAEGGTVTADKTTAAAREAITVTVTPAEGYKIAEVKYNDIVLTVDADGKCTFEMPAANVTVTATFVEDVAVQPEAKWGTSKDSLTNSGKLQDAFTAAATDSTVAYIQLQKDVEGAVTVNGGTFTLDLNGKTLSSNDNSTLEISGGNVTIADSANGGTIISNKDGCSGVEIGKLAKLTVNGGTITGRRSGISALVYSTLTVNGGSISGGSYGIESVGTVTINKIDSLSYEKSASYCYHLNMSTGSTVKIQAIPEGANWRVNFGGVISVTLPANYAGKDSGGKLYSTADLTGYGVQKVVTLVKAYAVNVGEIENGTVQVPALAEANSTVTITPTPAADYKLATVTVDGKAIEAVEGVYSFTMPAKDVTVAATFAEKQKFTITLKKESEYGKVNFQPSGYSSDWESYPEDTKITLVVEEVTPGYIFKKWNVISGNVTIEDNKFTLTDNVVIEPVFEKGVRVEMIDGFGEPLGGTFALGTTLDDALRAYKEEIGGDTLNIEVGGYLMRGSEKIVEKDTVLQDDDKIVLTYMSIADGGQQYLIVLADCKLSELPDTNVSLIYPGKYVTCTYVINGKDTEVKITDTMVQSEDGESSELVRTTLGEALIAAGISENLIENGVWTDASGAAPDFTAAAPVENGYVLNYKTNVTITDAENGTVSTDPEAPKAGDKVTVLPTPNNGYMVDKITVKDEAGNEIPVNAEDNSFTMPEGGVTITVTFKEQTNQGGSVQPERPSYPTYWPVVDETTTGDQDKTEQHYAVLCRKLNVRAGAGTQFDKIGSLSRGAIVHGEDMGNGWIKIEYDGETGYISAQYAEEVEADCTKIVSVICRKLNVRKGADTRCGKLGSVSRGDALCVVSEKDGWYEVLYNGGTAWVCAKYVA